MERRGYNTKKEEAKEDKGHGGSTLDGGILPWGTKRKRKTGGRGPVAALNAATGLPPLVPQSSSSPFSLFFHA